MTEVDAERDPVGAVSLPRFQKWQRAHVALTDHQKPSPGVPAYTRWVNRRVAAQVAAAAHAFGLSPNTITFTSLAFSAFGIAILIALPPTVAVGVAVAVLFAVAYLFDSADGQLARVSGRSGPSGEWLDHVVDSIRTPAMHLAVAVAVVVHGLDLRLGVLAVVVAVLLSGQFLSQILAEQLSRGSRHVEPTASGKRQSWILLPTDPGTWAWVFLLWGLGAAFIWAYAVLAACAVAHIAVSMMRRYRELQPVVPGGV